MPPAINPDLPRDQVIVKNTTSAAITIILSYQPVEKRYAARLLGGAMAGAVAVEANANFELGFEQVVREARPQKFTLRPKEESDALAIEIGTKKLYYTVIVPNGREERVPRENMLWPLPRYHDRFLPWMNQQRRGNVLEITDMHGTRSIATSLTMLTVIVLVVLYGPSVWAFCVDLASPANNRRPDLVASPANNWRPIVYHLTRLQTTCGELLKSSKMFIRNNRQPIVHHLTRLQTTCGELLKSSKVYIRNNRYHLTRLQTTCGELLKSSKVYIRKTAHIVWLSEKIRINQVVERA